MNDFLSTMDGDALHFEATSAQKRAGTDEGARGEILDEIGAVNLVELFVQGKVGTKDLDGDEIVHRHVGGGQRRLYSVEQEPDFFFELRRRLAGFRIDADPARQIKRVANAHGVAVGQRVLSTRKHDVPRRFRVWFWRRSFGKRRLNQG